MQTRTSSRNQPALETAGARSISGPLRTGVPMEVIDWNVLIRNVSGIGFLGVVAYTLKVLLEGLGVRTLLLSWFGGYREQDAAQLEMRQELLRLRNEVDALRIVVDSRTRLLDAPPEPMSTSR